jgi:hypothetical protein
MRPSQELLSLNARVPPPHHRLRPVLGDADRKSLASDVMRGLYSGLLEVTAYSLLSLGEGRDEGVIVAGRGPALRRDRPLKYKEL